MGEWLKPTDCKSVPPSEVRRFESFPVHQIELHQIKLSRLAGVTLSAVEGASLLAKSRAVFARDRDEYESLGNGVDCVRSFGCAGVSHAK